MTTATAVTLDREAVERFIVEVDALALLDSRLHGRVETYLQQRIYGAIEDFERAAFGRRGDLHERAYSRVQELWQEFVAEIGGDDAR